MYSIYIINCCTVGMAHPTCTLYNVQYTSRNVYSNMIYNRHAPFRSDDVLSTMSDISHNNDNDLMDSISRETLLELGCDDHVTMNKVI